VSDLLAGSGDDRQAQRGGAGRRSVELGARGAAVVTLEAELGEQAEVVVDAAVGGW
jgi:hypothetical protein